MMPALALALVAQVSGPTWSEALKLARERNTLVLAVVRDHRLPEGDRLADRVLADGTVREAIGKVVVFVTKDRTPGGFRTPLGPYAVFFNEDGEVRGFGTLLTTPALFARLSSSAFRLWKAHDSLDFRTRRAGNDGDIADAAASFALRTDRPKAKGLLARLSPSAVSGTDSSSVESARAAYAEACLIAKDRSSSEDTFRLLEVSKDLDRRWSAKLGLARLYAEIRPRDSESRLLAIVESSEAPEHLRLAAAALQKPPGRS